MAQTFEKNGKWWTYWSCVKRIMVFPIPPECESPKGRWAVSELCSLDPQDPSRTLTQGRSCSHCPKGPCPAWKDSLEGGDSCTHWGLILSLNFPNGNPKIILLPRRWTLQNLTDDLLLDCIKQQIHQLMLLCSRVCGKAEIRFIDYLPPCRAKSQKRFISPLLLALPALAAPSSPSFLFGFPGLLSCP